MTAAFTLRPYEPAATGDIVALWDRAIGDRYPLRQEVLRDCLEGDRGHHPGDAVIAWDGGRPIGFGYLVLVRDAEPEMTDRRGVAWLQAVVVDPSRRREGIGRAIVGSLVSGARAAGVGVVECGSGFFYLWPGLPSDLPDALPFAEAMGFVAGERSWDLRGDVAAVDEAESRQLIAEGGLIFEPAGPADRGPLLAFLLHEFGSEWWHDIRWFLDRGGDIGDIVLLRDSGAAIVGFARLHKPGSRPIGPPMFWTARRPPAAGGLGPIGVAASVRGRGFGLALLTLGLARLRDAGLSDVVIDFTSLLDFYGRLGFRPWLEFTHARGAAEDIRRRTSTGSDRTALSEGFDPSGGAR